MKEKIPTERFSYLKHLLAESLDVITLQSIMQSLLLCWYLSQLFAGYFSVRLRDKMWEKLSLSITRRSKFTRLLWDSLTQTLTPSVFKTKLDKSLWSFSKLIFHSFKTLFLFVWSKHPSFILLTSTISGKWLENFLFSTKTLIYHFSSIFLFSALLSTQFYFHTYFYRHRKKHRWYARFHSIPSLVSFFINRKYPPDT